MGSIADITEKLAVALFRAIGKHDIDFVAGTIPNDPPSEYMAVNALLHGTALMSHNNKGIIDFCNYKAAEIFGKTIEEMLGMLSAELAPDIDNIRQNRERYLEQSLTIPITLQNARRWQWQPDGSRREILIDAKVFPYEHEGVISNAASIRFNGYYQPQSSNLLANHS